MRMGFHYQTTPMIVSYLRQHWGKLLILLVFLGVNLCVDLPVQKTAEDVAESLGLPGGKTAYVMNHGRLAPIPKERKDYRLWHTLTEFYDYYTLEFSAPSADVAAWMKQSPGIAEAEYVQEAGRDPCYRLKHGGVLFVNDDPVNPGFSRVRLTMGHSE